jgi:hypothetical protein
MPKAGKIAPVFPHACVEEEKESGTILTNLSEGEIIFNLDK